jgi:predicted kinase
VAVESAQLISEELRVVESLGKLPEPAAKPFFIAVSGLPGTGKSHFCRMLAERLPVALLESDAVRKLLFPRHDYSFRESNCLFKVIHGVLEKLLSNGTSVAFDATNLSERNREYLYNIADRLQVRLILVRVSAPPELVRERLQARLANRSEKSDADWEVYLKMQPTEEKIRRRHYVVDTSQDTGAVVDRIVREALK